MRFLGILLVCLILHIGEAARYYGDDHRVDCEFSVWAEWSRLGGGPRQVRTRHISSYPSSDGTPCKGPRIEYREWTDGPDSEIPPMDMFISKFLPGDRPEQSQVIQNNGAVEEYALPRDILVLIDTTAHGTLFPYYKMMMSSLIGEMCGNFGRRSRDNRVAIAVFNRSDANTIQNFHDRQRRETIQDKILNIRPSENENPDLPLALSLASSTVMDTGLGARNESSSAKEVLLLTTYKDICSRRAIHEANILKAAASVYVILVGDDLSLPAEQISCVEEHVASDPSSSHFLRLESSQNLIDFTQKLLLLTAEGTDICSQNGY